MDSNSNSICPMAVAIKRRGAAAALDALRDTALGSSRSEPGRAHRVTRDGCDGAAFSYRYRRRARIEAMTAARQQQREEARA